MEDKFSTLKAEVKKTFQAYLTANGNVRERAKAHGEALIWLRRECAEQRLDFVATLKELGVVVSTAYHHIKLALSCEQAECLARTMGVEFEAMTITEVIESVRRPKTPKTPKQIATHADGDTSDQVPTTADGSAPTPGTHQATGEVFAHSDPAAVAVPPLAVSVQMLIDQNLVRVVHGERGHSVQVEVGNVLVLVVPR